MTAWLYSVHANLIFCKVFCSNSTCPSRFLFQQTAQYFEVGTSPFLTRSIATTNWVLLGYNLIWLYNLDYNPVRVINMEPRQGISTASSHLDPSGSYRGLTGQKMWTCLLVHVLISLLFLCDYWRCFQSSELSSKDHRTWSGMFLKWGFRWFSGVFTVTTRMWLMFEPGISKSQAILILHT